VKILFESAYNPKAEAKGAFHSTELTSQTIQIMFNQTIQADQSNPK